MNKKEEFKNFARLHPELLDYIKNKEMTWQSFYEIYDIYGTDENAWSKYLNQNSSVNSKETVNMLTEKLKSIDVNSIQEHIKTAQKALSIVSELTGKSDTVAAATSAIPKVPRPINKFFED